MSLDYHLSLIRWVSANRGYLHPDIELAFNVDKGYHAKVVAGRTLEPGSCIARCSMTTSLSVLNALHNPPFSSRGTMFPSAFLLNQKVPVVQCFFLMEQWLLQDKSWWAPYLSTLPKPDEIGDRYFVDKEEDLLLFQGTNLQTAIRKQSETWKAQFTKGLDHLKRLDWPNATNGRYTWELFRWASTMFGSRSFTSQVLSNTLPADKARPMGHLDPDHDVLSALFEDGFAVLLPLLDILNYRPLSRVEWQAGLNEVGLQVLESFDGGQEVCNNYGPRDNEALILGYGFSINANPFDHYAVGFKVPPGSPLAEARSWRADQLAKANKRSKTDDEYRYYIFNAEHPRTKTANSLETSIFSQDLFDSISVLSANFRELQSDRFKSTGSVLDLSRKRLTDVKQHRNVLHTLCQLRLECSRRAEAIKAAISKLNVESSGALFQKQQYARFYRDSQLQILETATLLCRYCLFKAQNPARQDADLIGSAAAAERMPRSSEAQENVQELVRKMPSVINIRILFSFPDAVELLPANLASKVRHTTEVFRSALDKKSVLQVQEKWAMAHGWEEKIGFTVLLAELRELYSGQSTALSTHLQAWMMKLQKWYSFDDAFWNNPTEDFLPALEAMVEAANLIAPDANDVSMAKGWSEPHMLCWGWNVQEEEGLFSETEVLATEADGSSVQPSGYLLCITGGFGSNGLPN